MVDSCAARRFNDKHQDDLSNLGYYGFRYYDKLSLSWTQSDPLFRFLPDLTKDKPRLSNLYTFSLHNSLRYLDPDGRWPGTGFYFGLCDGPSCRGEFPGLAVPSTSDDESAAYAGAVGRGLSNVSNIVQRGHVPNDGTEGGIGNSAAALGRFFGGNDSDSNSEDAGIQSVPVLPDFKGNIGHLSNRQLGGRGTSQELSKSAEKAIKSHEKKIAEHEAKLAAYKKDPFAFDNNGHLKRASGNKDLQQKIINSRINNLEDEIQTYKDNIEKIRKGIIKS